MEWLLKSAREPKEIVSFINQVFEVYEQRAKVGRTNGITFIVHSNEQNHTIPHIHAQYGEYEVSIAIHTGEVLAGNIPAKNLKKAVEWVSIHKEKLLSDWANYSLSAKSSTTGSLIGRKP